MSNNIQIAIAGGNGNMGTLLSELIESKGGFEVSGIFNGKAQSKSTKYHNFQTIKEIKADYLFVFVPASVIRGFIKRLWITLEITELKGIIIGSSGLCMEQDSKMIREYAEKNNKVGCVIPNFSIGAMYQKIMSKELDDNFNSVSIVEKHNTKKIDYPSGTAIDLANSLEGPDKGKGVDQIIDSSFKNKTKETIVNNIKINSIRSDEYIAEQIVNFENENESLIIEHIVNDRKAYLAGINLVLDSLDRMSGYYVGLESIIETRN
mgnify:CR=1 FL=1|tara:strand:+ start:79 stop:870 length:792 start_codon:yes stop_codon:yes gene_type:complete